MPHETTIQANEYMLRYRSLEIRFYIVKSMLVDGQQRFRVRCVSRLDRYKSFVREKTMVIDVHSTDYLNNQKLVNLGNTGRYPIFFLFTIPANTSLQIIYKKKQFFHFAAGSMKSINLILLFIFFIPFTA